MAKFDRQCTMCKTTYQYCPNCKAFDHLPVWMTMFCGQNCHDIFHIANDFAHNNISKDDARKLLGGHDLSKMSMYPSAIAKNINDIMQKDEEKEIKSIVVDERNDGLFDAIEEKQSEAPIAEEVKEAAPKRTPRKKKINFK